MPDLFKPYHNWLGIPPEEQPPTHYRLLGIAPLEDDPEVIEAAADRMMAQLRTYQTGGHSRHSERLLNEVAAARICLLRPEKKTAYEIVFVNNGKEQRVAVEADVWSKPTIIEVRWRSRTSHFRRIEIKAGTMVPVD